MAHHKSAKKRIRQSAMARLSNRYRLTTLRSALKKIKELHGKTDAQKLLPEVVSKIDQCVKHNIFHRNKAARMKSQLSRHVAALA